MNSRAMVALERFPYPYGARDLAPGDIFEAVSETDAHALRLTGRARDASSSDSEKAASAEKPAAPGRYKRRDMAAG